MAQFDHFSTVDFYQKSFLHLASRISKSKLLHPNMKFLSVFATLALFTTLALSLAFTDEESIIQRVRSEEAAGSPDLLKRACDYSTPCKGYGWSVGLHCGDGAFGCVKGHVYQIGSDTNVCDYGVRTSCQKCNKLSCP